MNLAAIDAQASQIKRALDELQRLPEQFASAISQSRLALPPDTALTFNGDVITGKVFGVSLIFDWKPVFCDGLPHAIQHTVVTAEEPRLDILRLYQAPNGRVYEDPALQMAICDTSNEYLPKLLIGRLITAIAHGPIFAPDDPV